MLAGVALLGVLATTRPPVTSGPTTFAAPPPQAISASGISDERAFYYGDEGLLRWSRQRPLPDTRSVVRGRELQAAAEPQVITYPQVGFLGYYAGPAVHVVDEYALGDPLLARLPAQPNWRIGHYLRTVPEGYLETIRTGRNTIQDADTAMLYDRLTLITQGSLWSRRRCGRLR
jgi:arabinofuranosyltransferase